MELEYPINPPTAIIVLSELIKKFLTSVEPANPVPILKVVSIDPLAASKRILPLYAEPLY